MKIVFIIGAGRSGTTLLTNMLNQHSKIVAPPENEFLINQLIRQSVQGHLSSKAIQRYIDNLWIRKPEFKQVWNLNEEILREDLMIGDRSFQSIYKTTLASYSRDKEPTLVIDKNPFYTANIPLLRSFFSDAKFISVIRDNRGRLDSIKRNKDAIFSDDVLRAAKWVDFNKEILKLNKYEPGLVCQIHYEQLVNNPRKELSRLMKFVDMEIEENMLNYFKTPRIILDASSEIQKNFIKMHSKSDEQIDLAKVSDWKESLSLEEEEELSYFCKELSDNLGYPTMLDISEERKKEIKAKYRWRILKSKFFWKFKRLSYYLPLYLQRYLIKFHRWLLNKKSSN